VTVYGLVRSKSLLKACNAKLQLKRVLAWVTLPALLGMHSVAISSEEDTWAATVSEAAQSVVSLQLSHLRDFDDSNQGGSNATGFVVDAERGIVLTNRHVVGSGPIRINATFQNQERVVVVPLYRDPIHDFAFVRYEPELLEYAKPLSLQLRPDKVSTGMNIRVIGSDGGEQLSILPGTIARLDREVPSYGRYGYNDFNTFYLQAASGTSGGSSGSPVIDIDGDVVALNAAANTQTASSFFLPLPRIQYALASSHKPFRELTRLGLSAELEARVRANDESTSGMLTVAQVIPGGAADEKFEPGDILVSIEGNLITDFIGLEDTLDQAIGKSLSVELIRLGKVRKLSVSVEDLNALAPSQLFELGDAVVQDMSIQHARAMNLPQRGVVVMRTGYVFTKGGIPQGALIIDVDGNPITDLASFIAAIAMPSESNKKRIRFIVPRREFSSEISMIQIDNNWFDNRLCERQDGVRFWSCAPVELPALPDSKPQNLIEVPQYQDSLLNQIAPAMVRIDFSIPYVIDNVYARHFKGVGIIIDKEEGLVAVDRNTVPIGLGDVDVTFFGSLLLPGKVVYLHPRHNIALVKYDSEKLGDAPFEALQLSDNATPMPDDVTMIGYRSDGTFRSHSIDDISRLTIGFNQPGLPRFQQANTDVYGVPNVPPSLGGPLVDQDGLVHAVYMSFAFEEDREIKEREWAMPSSLLLESLKMYRSAEPYYSMDATLNYQPLAVARRYGLPDEWLSRYNQQPAEIRRVLYISQIIPNTDAASKLAPGDFLIAIDGVLVSELFTAEKLSQKPAIDLTVLRDGLITTVELNPSELSSLGTKRLVSWGGATFQSTFADIGYQKGVDFPGVYIASTQEGSPALWDRLYRNRFVIAVEGEPVNNLDDLLALVKARKQDEITRLTVISMSGRKSIITVKPEYNFWPTFEIVRTDDGWQRVNHM